VTDQNFKNHASWAFADEKVISPIVPRHDVRFVPTMLTVRVVHVVQSIHFITFIEDFAYQIDVVNIKVPNL
jgi:hypothetical protein